MKTPNDTFQEAVRTPDGPGPPLKGGEGGPDHLREVLRTAPGPRQDQDQSAALRVELDELMSKRVADYARRREERAELRQQLARARHYGLAKRHARKESR